MDNVKMMEEMLKKYSYYKFRIAFLEREKRMLIHELPVERVEGCACEDDCFEYSSEISATNKDRVIKDKERDSIFKSKDDLPQKIKEIDSELSQIKYLTEKVDVSLNMIKDFNERYKLILESYYVRKIRMEDIADLTHTSRSRCYELCKEAITFMAKIVFGDT